MGHQSLLALYFKLVQVEFIIILWLFETWGNIIAPYHNKVKKKTKTVEKV